jgi:decaprenyl-phosphate phosphoribosyltransferase
MMPIFELLRVRQWVKNGFVLAPLFFGSELLNTSALLHSAAAFAIFCLISSAVYIFNDWRDIEADRRHLKKRARPLATGAISIGTAGWLLVALVALAAAVGLLSDLPKAFYITLAAYVAINVGYSLGLKHVALVELFLVASGFVLRLLAGSFHVQMQLSPWIIIATGMIALQLAVGKRRGDIAQQNDVGTDRKSLLDYNVAYLDAVLAALTGGTLVVYLLFCVSDYAVNRFGPLILMTSVPVALGLFRYLQLIIVREKGESPTDLVLGDAGMLLVLAVFVLMFGGLIYF